ncbi:hypothetical protein ATANTOWER_009668 [Ataeniobius toweri]|uniref:Uncharacterized protein n=1 Tax=Ataeniobius toweri TaxID=208326 RepID=A0ABU7B6K3_9TELE|nr:hypothetical protein [Ataeniobius toweri]
MFRKSHRVVTPWGENSIFIVLIVVLTLKGGCPVSKCMAISDHGHSGKGRERSLDVPSSADQAACSKLPVVLFHCGPPEMPFEKGRCSASTEITGKSFYNEIPITLRQNIYGKKIQPHDLFLLLLSPIFTLPRKLKLHFKYSV